MTTLRQERQAPTVPVQVMGILNVTPDSFSDGGRWMNLEAAIDHATAMSEQGAHIIDVGGESTRPGAKRVSVEGELDRVLPVVRELVRRGIRVSVDTMNAATAAKTAEAGAEFINDVSGGLSDAEMYRVVAATGVKYIAMHWRGHGEQMQANASYRDVVSDVHRELTIRVAEAIVWGVDPGNILIDPGLGFAKTAEHNWQLLNALPSFVELGFPVLIGASRKAFLKEFAAEGAAPQERDEATATISALSAQAGAWGVRVHNIPATRRVLDVWDRWNGAGA